MGVNDAANLVNSIYPGIDSPQPPPPKYFLNHMVLAPCNLDVSDVNNILNHMASDEHVYYCYSVNEIIQEHGADPDDDMPVTPEFLHSINSSSLPPGELQLKVGCPLILLRNLSPSQGLCNGTRMVLTCAREQVLEVCILGGDHDGKMAFIPCISHHQQTMHSNSAAANFL